MQQYHNLQRWSSKFCSLNPVLLVYGCLLLCMLRAICDFLMADWKECICIKFCFKLSSTTSEKQEVNQRLTLYCSYRAFLFDHTFLKPTKCTLLSYYILYNSRYRSLMMVPYRELKHVGLILL